MRWVPPRTSALCFGPSTLFRPGAHTAGPSRHWWAAFLERLRHGPHLKLVRVPLDGTDLLAPLVAMPCPTGPLHLQWTSATSECLLLSTLSCSTTLPRAILTFCASCPTATAKDGCTRWPRWSCRRGPALPSCSRSRALPRRVSELEVQAAARAAFTVLFTGAERCLTHAVPRLCGPAHDGVLCAAFV